MKNFYFICNIFCLIISYPKQRWQKIFTQVKVFALYSLKNSAAVDLSTPQRKDLALWLKDQILEKQNLENPDFWLNNNTQGHGRRIVSFTEQQGEGWLGFSPGDIIYYNGAFGLREMLHFGVYIGRGFVVEFWCNDRLLKKAPYDGAIVLNSLEFLKINKQSFKCAKS